MEEESWQPPDPELIQKLVAQIEYYLSDENLEHDAFLLKHVRRNKLGFVSVKLLTSFKKVTMAANDNMVESTKTLQEITEIADLPGLIAHRALEIMR